MKDLKNERLVKSHGHWLRRSLAMSLAACLLNLGSPAVAADISVGSDADLKDALTDAGRADGDVITLDPGVEMDLSGSQRVVVEKKVTIKGQAGAVAFYDSVKELTGNLGAAVKNTGIETVMAGMDSAVTALEGTLTANLPGTKLKGGTDSTGGIYFKDTSSLINLTISDFNVDVTSGATYLPQITDTLVADANGKGFDRFENLAVVGNSIKNDNVIDGAVLGTPSNGTDAADGDPGHYAPQFMKGVVFMDNYIESTANRVTGGAMGAWGAYHTVENSAFINNTIKASRVASGSAMAPDHIYNLLGSLFYGNSSESLTSSGRGAIYIYKSNDQFGLNLMENTFFIKNKAKGSSAYGAAISDRTLGGLGDIKNSVFALNEITGTVSAYGGVFDAGSGGASATSGGGGVHSITGSVFYGNKATAGSGTAFGGAIDLGVRSAYRDDPDWRSFNLTTTITDSQFLNNEAISNTPGKAWGGAIMVETNGYVTGALDPNIKTIDFAATGGGETVFSGNTANGEANAIYVGQQSGTSNFDVVFNMKPAAGGLVSFDDPITVNMNAKSFTLNSLGRGDFYWNGANDFNAAGGSFINFESGLNTLGSDFTLKSSNSDDIAVTMGQNAAVNIDLAGRDKNLAVFDGVASFASAGASLGIGSSMIGDFSGSWLLATGAALPELDDFILIRGIDQATIVGLDSSQTGKLTMNVARAGTDGVFRDSGANAVSAQSKITDVFNNYLSGPERTAIFTEVMGNLAALTGESAVSQAVAGLQAIKGASAKVFEYKNQAVAHSAPPSGGYGDSAANRIWGGFLGFQQDQDSQKGFAGYEADMFGGIFGLSHDFSENFSGGLYLAAGSGDIESSALRAKTDTRMTQFGLLGDYDFGSGFSLSGDVNYSRLDNEARRNVPGAPSAKADFNQTAFGFGLEAAYAFSPWEGGRIRPFLNLRYQHLDQDAFTESGGGVWAMDVEGVESDSFTSTLGAGLSHDILAGRGEMIVTPEFSAAWVHEFGDDQISSRSQYVVSPGFFRVKSPETDQDFARVGASLALKSAQEKGFAFQAGYEGTLGSSFTGHSYYGTLSFRW